MVNVEVRHYSSILFTLLPPADLAANKHLSAALLKLAGSISIHSLRAWALTFEHSVSCNIFMTTAGKL